MTEPVNKSEKKIQPFYSNPLSKSVDNLPKQNLQGASYYYDIPTASVYNGNVASGSLLSNAVNVKKMPAYHQPTSTTNKAQTPIVQSDADIVNGRQEVLTSDRDVSQTYTTPNRVIQSITVENNNGTNQSVEQKVTNALESNSIIRLNKSSNIEVKQSGSEGVNEQLTDVTSCNKIKLETNANGGNDDILSILRETSESNVILNGGDGSDTIVQSIKDTQNSKIYINGNSLNNSQDTKKDNIRITIHNQSKNNEVYINSSVENAYPKDKVVISVPENTDFSKVKTDKQSRTMEINGNKIYLGKNIEFVTLEYTPTITKAQRLQAIKDNPSLTKEVKEQQIANTMKFSDDSSFSGDKVTKLYRFINPKEDYFLPDSVTKLLKSKAKDPVEFEKLQSSMAVIYQDPKGKLLIDKMVQNGIPLTLLNKEDFEKKVDIKGAMGVYDDEIFIREQEASSDYDHINIHEMGHGATGHLTFNFSKFKTVNQDDDNSFTEELHNNVLAYEIKGNINGDILNYQQMQDYAKSNLLDIINYPYYQNLPIDNNFLQNLKEWTGVSPKYSFSVEELYEQLLKEEDKNSPIPRLPQFEHIWKKYDQQSKTP